MTGPLDSARRRYGAPLWHLAALAACFLVALYALTRVVSAGILVGFAVWFVGAVILHDLVVLPLYAGTDALIRGRRRWPVNHVRVPAALSALLLVVWSPLILRGSDQKYREAVGLGTQPYLLRWLLLTAVFFACSGLLYAARRLTARRRVTKAR